MKEADRLNLEEKRTIWYGCCFCCCFCLCFLLGGNNDWKQIWAGCSSKHQDYISFFAYFPFHPNTSKSYNNCDFAVMAALGCVQFLGHYPLTFNVEVPHCALPPLSYLDNPETTCAQVVSLLPASNNHSLYMLTMLTMLISAAVTASES